MNGEVWIGIYQLYHEEILSLFCIKHSHFLFSEKEEFHFSNNHLRMLTMLSPFCNTEKKILEAQ